MLAKTALIAVAALAAVTGVTSTPLSIKRSNDLVPRTSQSFNNWGGLSSMSGFDNFFGVDNFDGSRCSQTIITTQQEIVCHTQSIEIIQQRLLVIQEMAKKIITETICEVETQTIVFEQWHASLGGFSQDLRRLSGKQVGYDQNIASQHNGLLDTNGNVTTNNLGFSGQDLGNNTVLVNGHNWNNSSSFMSVGAAYRAARDAVNGLH